MVASSILNPGSIVRERSGAGSPSGAANFITGGSPLGRGIVSNAANKIVQFNRASVSGVAARPPDLGSMISTLSTNILNNVENQVSSINNNVTQLVTQRLAEVRENYRSRLDKIDAARPNAILGNFLNLYREAIGYIQFLGNQRNVKTLGNNLKALQRIFRDSFRVARIVRQTIGRIVKQLSGLPQASGGPGGINLDIKVPGGGLKRSAPTGIMRAMRRRPGMMLGGAALAGGLGTAVVSGMMDRGGGVQTVPSSEGAIPPVLLDRFGSILDRFSKAIEHLTTGSAEKDDITSAPSAPSALPMTSTEDDGGGGGGGGAAVTDAPDLKTAIRQLESGNDYSSMYSRNRDTFSRGREDITKMTIDQVHDLQTDYLNHQKSLGYNSADGSDRSAAMGAYQMIEVRAVAKEMGIDTSKTLFNKETQDRMSDYYLNVAGYQDWKAGKITDAEFNNQLAVQFASVKKTSGRGAYDNDGMNKAYGNIMPVLQKEKGLEPQTPDPKVTTPEVPNVMPATMKKEDQQQIAQTVSQPPASTTPQVTVAPLNLSSPQPQGGGGGAGGGAISGGGGGKQTGPSVPLLNPSNSDNFLLLYSKMVYNIVDG